MHNGLRRWRDLIEFRGHLGRILSFKSRVVQLNSTDSVSMIGESNRNSVQKSSRDKKQNKYWKVKWKLEVESLQLWKESNQGPKHNYSMFKLKMLRTIEIATYWIVAKILLKRMKGKQKCYVCRMWIALISIIYISTFKSQPRHWLQRFVGRWTT